MIDLYIAMCIKRSFTFSYIYVVLYYNSTKVYYGNDCISIHKEFWFTVKYIFSALECSTTPYLN